MEQGPKRAEHKSLLDRAMPVVGLMTAAALAFQGGLEYTKHRQDTAYVADSPMGESPPSLEPLASETPSTEPTPSVSPTVADVPSETASPAASEAPLPEPTPTATETTPTAAPTETAPVQDEFSAGAFNILYNTVPGSSWSQDKWPYRLGLSVGIIRKYLDVVALQEVRPVPLQAMQKNEIPVGENGTAKMLGEEFGIFPQNDNGYGSQNPVAWRRSEFEFMEGKLIAGPHVTRAGVWPDSAALVKLQHIPTKRFVYVISEHAPVGADRAEPRHTNAEARANYVRQLQQEHPDALIIYGGDLNSYYNATPGDPQPTKDNDPQKTAYCLITNVGGLVDALDAFEHRDDENLPDKCQPRDVHRVDHLFFSNRKWIRVKGYQYGGGENGELDAPKNGSDVHHTLVTTVKVEAPTNP